jgi:hypothetical protein
MMKEEHFTAGHIHTTPEGRHFRHGDGVEVDGEGEPIGADERAIDDGTATAQALDYTVRQYAQLRAYLPSTAARVLAESAPREASAAVVATLLALSRLLAERGE